MQASNRTAGPHVAPQVIPQLGFAAVPIHVLEPAVAGHLTRDCQCPGVQIVDILALVVDISLDLSSHLRIVNWLHAKRRHHSG